MPAVSTDPCLDTGKMIGDPKNTFKSISLSTSQALTVHLSNNHKKQDSLINQQS